MELTSFALTENDFYLITRALRKMSEQTNFGDIKNDASNLIKYLEDEKKEKSISTSAR